MALQPSTTEAGTAPPTPTPTTTSSSLPPGTDSTPSSSLPPGAVAGLDDYDGDGQPDPTCGTQDFGAGLVLRIPCSISTAHTPEDGTVLIDKSLYRLPGENPPEFDGLSGNLLEARDEAGAKVFIIIFNTDALFVTNSASINSAGTLDATIRAINTDYAGSAVQVRGHTDATGTASSNQVLSERRAATVQQYLQSHGLNASSVTAVGLSSTEPLVEEHNADGTPNLAGRRFNRRVEIVIRINA